MRLYRQPAAPADKVPDHLAAKYETEAHRYWEAFYKRNADKFFKDRHYFDMEFPELLQGQLTVLEVGCGVGNTLFPLLELNPDLQLYACDFSPTAVQLVQAHPAYQHGRAKAWVGDITSDQLLQQLPGACVDYCSMVFVLSAVAPEKMPQALRNVASVLKPGAGRVLFRDYAQGDLAQTRLEQGSSGVKFIQQNFYVRGDGTCCYYYTEDGLRALFAAEGFVCESTKVHARVIENRKSGVKMPRRWIQAVFRYAPHEAATQQQERQERQQEEAAGQLAAGTPSSSTAGFSSSSSSTMALTCAGRAWQVPASSSACVCQMAQELDQLLGSQQQWQQQQQGQQQQQWQGQQLLLLGRHVLLAPPWLALQCGHCHGRFAAAAHNLQQQDHGSLRLLQHQSAQPTAAVACGDSSSSSQANEVQYAQGAAAALFAVVAVWVGARRVYACMPGQASKPGAYEAGFTAVLRLNECRIVCERIRQRRWDVSQRRHTQLLARDLQRDLQQQQGRGIDLVVGQAAAAGGGDDGVGGSCGGCVQEALDRQEVQGYMDQVFARAQQQQQQCDLLLWAWQ